MTYLLEAFNSLNLNTSESYLTILKTFISFFTLPNTNNIWWDSELLAKVFVDKKLIPKSVPFNVGMLNKALNCLNRKLFITQIEKCATKNITINP